MATVTTTLAAGSTASPYYLNTRIVKQLCNKTPNTPIFNPTFTLVSYKLVSTTEAAGQYEAIVNVSGIVTYTPCGQCCAKSQTVNENFVIPFYTTTAPSVVSVSGGTAINSLITDGGCRSCCSNLMQSDIPLTLTVTTA